MRVNIGSLRALLFFDPSFGFGVIDTWGEDWRREDIGVLFGLGPFNVGLEMVQDGNSIRVLDVLWALGRVAKAVPSLFEDCDPLDVVDLSPEEIVAEEKQRFEEGRRQFLEKHPSCMSEVGRGPKDRESN